MIGFFLRMPKIVLLRTVEFFARRRVVGSRLLRRFSVHFIKLYDGESYNSKFNGEEYLLKLLKDRVNLAFDVGANKGEWSKMLLHHCPAAEVHAFEIIPEIAEQIRDTEPSIKQINHYGLSNSSGLIEVKRDPFNDERNRAIIDDLLDNKENIVKATIETGDEYCRNNNIKVIDFLKVDVEGTEHLVLEGFSEMIGEGSIQIIQFEYNHSRIHSKFLLRDFYETYEDAFVLGKLTPRGVMFKNYELTDEDFRGPNYVMVRRTRDDLVKLVSA